MKFKFNRAESLVETLVAVFVLSLSAVAALTLMVTILRTVDDVKERVIATNLAREGIEAVRNIRESNWLEHPRERRDYWNCLGAEDCNIANEENLIQDDTYYIVDFDENFRWQLEKQNTSLDLNQELTTNSDYMLSLEKYADTEVDFYTHPDFADEEKDKAFFRQIHLRYLDDDKDIIEVKSRVEWRASGTRVAHIELTTYLTDFLGRELTIN